MKVTPASLPGVLVVEPVVFGDDRGFFLETFHALRYAQSGIAGPFVQDNLSRSQRGVLRGLHFQEPHPQAKLVSVLEGEVFDVAVDIRRGSPNFGKWFGLVLSAKDKRQVFLPAGFAHGFCVVSDGALFAYKCTDFHAPDCERGILWNDPDLRIEWPIRDPALSEKDANAPRLKDAPHLPVFRGP